MHSTNFTNTWERKEGKRKYCHLNIFWMARKKKDKSGRCNSLPLCIFITYDTMIKAHRPIVKADKPMKKSFLSSVASLMLRRWENRLTLNCLFYHMQGRLGHKFLLHPSSLQPHLCWERRKKKKLVWQHSNQVSLALNSSESHCFPLPSSFPLPFQILTLCLIWLRVNPYALRTTVLRTIILVLFKLSSQTSIFFLNKSALLHMSPS